MAEELPEEEKEEEEIAIAIPDEVFEAFDRDQYNRWDNARNQEDEGFAPFGTFEGQPIPSVPNIWTIWPFVEQYIGKDWNNPMIRKALQSKRFQSPLIRNGKITGYLGAGGFGMVWKIECEYRCSERVGRIFNRRWRRRELACKIIKHKYKDMNSFNQSFTEMLSLRYLRHKNICNICEIIGISDRMTGFPYSIVCIFLEICDGTLLQKVSKGIPPNYPRNIKQWALPEKLSRHWFAQICLGLEYIHSKGFFHNDIHELNILYQYNKALRFKLKPLSEDSDDEDSDIESHSMYEELFLSSVFKITDFGLTVAFSDEPDQVIQFLDAKRTDVRRLCQTFFRFAIPSLKGSNLNSDFFNFCQSGECDQQISEEWQSISPELKDLIQKMHLNGLFTLSGVYYDLDLNKILRHPWLQNNTEPRTQPYIWRENREVVPVIHRQKGRRKPRIERKNRKREAKHLFKGLPFATERPVDEMQMNGTQLLHPRRERGLRRSERRKRRYFDSLPFSPEMSRLPKYNPKRELFESLPFATERPADDMQRNGIQLLHPRRERRLRRSERRKRRFFDSLPFSPEMSRIQKI